MFSKCIFSVLLAALPLFSGALAEEAVQKKVEIFPEIASSTAAAPDVS